MRVMRVGSARDTGETLFDGGFEECCGFIWRQAPDRRRGLMILADNWTFGVDEIEARRPADRTDQPE
jgi:hypothetical protein